MRDLLPAFPAWTLPDTEFRNLLTSLSPAAPPWKTPAPDNTSAALAILDSFSSSEAEFELASDSPDELVSGSLSIAPFWFALSDSQFRMNPLYTSVDPLA